MEKKATSKRYPPELKERAVRMVKELRQQDPGDRTVIARVARQLGIGDESPRSWTKQPEIDDVRASYVKRFWPGSASPWVELRNQQTTRQETNK